MKREVKMGVELEDVEFPVLPYDLWLIIIDYVPFVSLIRLEKTCQAMYIMINQFCKECNVKSLTLSAECKSSWRIHYSIMGCPNIDQFPNPSCRLQKYLMSRAILISEYPDFVAQAYAYLCKRKMHVYTQAKIEGVLCWILWKAGLIPSKEVKSCLEVCSLHNNDNTIVYHWLMKKNHSQNLHLCGICVNQGRYKKTAQKYINYIQSLKHEGDLIITSEKPLLNLHHPIPKPQ